MKKRIFSFCLAVFILNVTTAQKIHWAESGSSKILRSDLDGNNFEELLSIFQATGMAIDGTKMYWTDGTDKVRRSDLDGSNIEDLVTTGLTGPQDIDVSGTKMYWIDANKVHRADLDGTNVEILVTGLIEARGIDVFGSKIYWADANAHKIQCSDLDGSNVQDLVTGLKNPIGVAIFNDKIYWTDFGYIGSNDKIQRADLNGSNVEDLITNLHGPIGIAAFGSKIYFTEDNAQKVSKADLDGSNVEVLFTNRSSPQFIDVSSLPLPVELANFSGRKKGESVHLTWETKIEFDNKGWEIEHSVDRKSWHAIGFVNGMGQSFSTQFYSFYDEHPAQGINYYRLKQMDFDGSFAYSGIISVNRKEDFVLSIHPNPTKSWTYFDFGEPFEEADILIYDAQGRTTHQARVYETSFSVNFEDFGEGFYIVQAHIGGKNYVQKLVKL